MLYDNIDSMAVNRKFSNYNSDYDLITLLKVHDMSALPENVQHDLTGLNNICNVNKYLAHMYHVLIGNRLTDEAYEMLTSLYENALVSLGITDDGAYNNVNITDTSDYYDKNDKNALASEKMLAKLIIAGVPNANFLKLVKPSVSHYDNYVQQYVYDCMSYVLYSDVANNAYSDDILMYLFRYEYEKQRILNIDNITPELNTSTVKNDAMLLSLLLDKQDPCEIIMDALKINNNNIILLSSAYMMLQCYSVLIHEKKPVNCESILKSVYPNYFSGKYESDFEYDLQLIINIANMFTYPIEYVFQNIELFMDEYIE